MTKIKRNELANNKSKKKNEGKWSRESFWTEVIVQIKIAKYFSVHLFTQIKLKFDCKKMILSRVGISEHVFLVPKTFYFLLETFFQCLLICSL